MSVSRKRISRVGSKPWSWEQFLAQENGIKVANVLFFPHAPLYECWSGIGAVGVVGEVDSSALINCGDVGDIREEWRNKEKKHFWHVEVVKYAGYFCQIRFLGYPTSQAPLIEKNKYWVHYNDVKEIGFYKPMDSGICNSPPFAIDATEHEVKNLLYIAIYNHYSVCKIDLELLESDKKYKNYMRKWPLEELVEVVNTDCCRQMRPGKVKKECGRRLFIKYCDFRSNNNEGYWVHDSSDLIKPSGWCKSVGADITAPEYYQPQILPLEKLGVSDPAVELKEGMMFEMVNPFRRNELAAGRVTKVLEHGFFLCRIQSAISEHDFETHCKEVNEFHFHISSAFIFPCGTAERYKQSISVPVSNMKDSACMSASFNWEKYFRQFRRTGTEPLPFPERRVISLSSCEYKPGMQLEAVDSHSPHLICPAKIVAVMSPYVMKIHFHGWEDEFDQWKSMDSKEVFPVGWCQLVNYTLTLPSQAYIDVGISSQRRRQRPLKKGVKRRSLSSSSSRSTSASPDDLGVNTVSSRATKPYPKKICT